MQHRACGSMSPARHDAESMKWKMKLFSSDTLKTADKSTCVGTDIYVQIYIMNKQVVDVL